MISELAKCPFCRSNGLLKGKVVYETKDAYIIENPFSIGNYLLIPEKHITNPLELPDLWWLEIKTLLTKLPNHPKEYNLTLNMGKNAGQSVSHIHFWLVPRTSNDPTAGKGLVGLINMVRKAD